MEEETGIVVDKRKKRRKDSPYHSSSFLQRQGACGKSSSPAKEYDKGKTVILQANKDKKIFPSTVREGEGAVCQQQVSVSGVRLPWELASTWAV